MAKQTKTYQHHYPSDMTLLGIRKNSDDEAFVVTCWVKVAKYIHQREP